MTGRDVLKGIHCPNRRSRFSVTIDGAAGGVKDLEHRDRHMSEDVAAYLIMSSR